MENKLIGKDAGKIWRLLAKTGRMTIWKIVELTNFPELYIFLTLGWLSRENKINYLEIEDELYVEVNKNYRD
ncbi:MAG: winged helix-turn-helix domain-containing protein [Candidatus Azobacteroides sp.]|nr:winged helix-turn-helix domain-containing protein [Candidatus Azobacteroides sp.]